MVSLGGKASKRGILLLAVLCLICGVSGLPKHMSSTKNKYSNTKEIIQERNVDEVTHLRFQNAISPDGQIVPDAVPTQSPPLSPPPRPPHTDLPPVETIGQQTPNQKNLKWYLIGGIAGGGLLLVVIIIITCCCICAAHRRETISNSVRPVKSVPKQESKEKEKEKEKEEKKKLTNDDDEVPVHPAARAAMLAAQQAKTNTLHGRASAATSPRPATEANPSGAAASTAPAAASSPSTSATPQPQLSQNAKEPAQPDATLALRALNSARPSAQAAFPEPPVVVAMDPLDPTSSSETRSSEESSEEESEEGSTTQSSEENSDENSSLSSESRSDESLPKLNFDPSHVDEDGFDEW